MARSQKPFVVEVKRGRRGAAAAPLTVVPKSPEAAHKTAAEPAPHPEPPKPQRRILDAIEPEPAVVEASDAASAVADPVKRRRGRPPKIAGAPPSPRKQRPVVARREEATVIAVAHREYPTVPADRNAPSRQPEIALRRQGQNHKKIGGHVVTQGRVTQPPVKIGSVTQCPQPDGPQTDGPLTHGHLTHGDRVEAATALPRGERWKRRLPKVLW